jgi:hypothetical protein
VKVPAVEDKLQIVYVPVNQLKPYKGNPRKINEKGIAKLQRSVEEFGFVNPILAQRGTNMIIAGHQRLKAAKAAGLTEVPVVWLDMDDVTAKAYNIADNRLQDEAEWDFTPLADLLTELDTGAFDLTLTGFDTDELEQMMNYTPGQFIEHSPDADRAGASPWARMSGDAGDGVMFTLGELACRVPRDTYERFLELVPEGPKEAAEFINGVLLREICHSG